LRRRGTLNQFDNRRQPGVDAAQRLRFPCVRRVGLTDRIEAGEVQLYAIALLADLAYLADHQGRGDQSQRHSVLRYHIAPRVFEISAEGSAVGNRYIAPPWRAFQSLFRSTNRNKVAPLSHAFVCMAISARFQS